MRRDLTEIVTIQQASAASTQARTVTWSSLAASIHAAVRSLNSVMGREGVRVGGVRAANQYEVETEYRGDVTPKMRIAWTPYGGSAKILEIVAVGQKWAGRRRRLVLTCAETA